MSLGESAYTPRLAIQSEYLPVLIVGAGPAGLATAVSLKQRGIESVIVDRAKSVGATWRRHYDRLHLHTTAEHSTLPHYPWPMGTPRYPSRDEVVIYLTSYARRFRIEPRFGEAVLSAYYTSQGWQVETSRSKYLAGRLIVATGYNDTPVIPEFPGLDEFPGHIRHGGDYKNGAIYEGKRTLVVGCGNSGAEIALDLMENGAETDLVVRSPIHVVPRELFGTPMQVTTLMMSKLPVPVADKLTKATLKLAVGDLSKYGIRRPEKGPIKQVIEDGRVPLIDVGTIDAIKAGKIGVRPGVDHVDGHEVVFVNGDRVSYDAIVLATGYRSAIHSWMAEADDVLNKRGYPIHHGEESLLPGLYFVGFKNPPTGMLREIAIEAKRIAQHVAKKTYRN